MGIAPALAACRLDIGEYVVLASMSPDPDVFVWDSRARLSEYASGIFDDAKTIMAHTTLAKPGTRAVVASCASAAVKPKYSVATYDAIGIKIVAGPYRNRWGWVSSEDVHAFRTAAGRPPAKRGP